MSANFIETDTDGYEYYTITLGFHERSNHLSVVTTCEVHAAYDVSGLQTDLCFPLKNNSDYSFIQVLPTYSSSYIDTNLARNLILSDLIDSKM